MKSVTKKLKKLYFPCTSPFWCVSIKNSVPSSGRHDSSLCGCRFIVLTSQSQAYTSWSQNGCTSSKQYICRQAKIKGQKAQQFLYPSIRSTKTFPRNLPSLAPPHSLPPSGLRLLKSYWSELGYSAIPTCKGDWERYPNWLRPVKNHCPG